MNTRLERLAIDKERLLARSALCRSRLAFEAQAVRSALHWKPMAVAAVGMPAASLLMLELAVSIVGLGRAARWVVVAGRVLLVARLARSILAATRRHFITA